MKVHHGFDNIPAIRNAVVAIGSFDGVHRGHRLLIDEMCELAKSVGGESVIITFDPHPRQLLRGENRLLSTLDEKLTLLAETGIDNVIVVNFTREFSMLSHHQFIEQYIIDKLHTCVLVAGENHHFGHNKEGDAKSLTEYGIRSCNLERFDNISSTQIRTAIERGEINEASALLGSKGYLVRTPVTEKSKLLPPTGMYSIEIDGIAAEMRLDDELINGKSGELRILCEV